MSLEVVLTKAAKSDVIEAASWYHARSASTAERFLAEVASAMSRVASQPTAQPVVDPATGIRRVMLRRFPYRLLYLVEEARAVIVAVMHSRRDDAAWRERLP